MINNRRDPHSHTYVAIVPQEIKGLVLLPLSGKKAFRVSQI